MGGWNLRKICWAIGDFWVNGKQTQQYATHPQKPWFSRGFTHKLAPFRTLFIMLISVGAWIFFWKLHLYLKPPVPKVPIMGWIPRQKSLVALYRFLELLATHLGATEMEKTYQWGGDRSSQKRWWNQRSCTCFNDQAPRNFLPPSTSKLTWP